MRRIVPLFLTLLVLSVMSPVVTAAVDGSYDTIFAGIGRTAFPGDLIHPSYSSLANQIISESNGNVLLGGAVQGDAQPYWWLGELVPGGTPVLTFGNSNGSGRVTSCDFSTYLCANGQSFSAMALQPDGRISVAGSWSFSRATVDANSLDTSGVIGGNGYVTTINTQINNAGGDFQVAHALVQTADGGWLVAGNGRYTQISNTDFAVIRLNADFSLDTTFNATTDGNNVTFAGGQIISFNGGYAAAAVLQADGRIVLAGPAGNSTTLGVVRLNSNGTLDSSFGAGTGKTVLSLTQGSLDSDIGISGIKIDGAGRIFIATTGTRTVIGNTYIGMAVVRLLPSGTPDPGFGTLNGVSYQTFLSPCDGGAYARALALDSAGRIVVAGHCTTASINKGFVERLHGDDGTLDTTFGSNGYSVVTFDSSTISDAAYAVAFDASSRPVVAGATTTPLGGQRAGVARLTYDLIFTNNMEISPPGRLAGQ